jgi:hypothetical protein
MWINLQHIYGDFSLVDVVDNAPLDVQVRRSGAFPFTLEGMVVIAGKFPQCTGTSKASLLYSQD